MSFAIPRKKSHNGSITQRDNSNNKADKKANNKSFEQNKQVIHLLNIYLNLDWAKAFSILVLTNLRKLGLSILE